MLSRLFVPPAAALVITCVVVLAFAQAVVAHRAPTKREAGAIRRAVVRACERLDDDIDCRGSKGIRVSTANRHYAIGSPRATDGFPAYYRAGLRLRRGRWRVVWEEINDLNILPCSEYRHDFPKAVIKDFRLRGFPGRWGAAPPVPCWKP